MLAFTAVSHVSGVHCPTTAYGNAVTAAMSIGVTTRKDRCGFIDRPSGGADGLCCPIRVMRHF